MNNAIRRITYGAAAIVLGAYIVIALRGPQGIPALLEKRREIRALEEQNANLSKQIADEQERVRKLKESKSAQETEVRKEWNLQRPGDVTLMLPDQPGQTPASGATTKPQ